MKASVRQQFLIPENGPLLEIRTTLDSALAYAEHFHTSFSFGLILAGRTCFSLGKEKYLAESGDIVLVAPEQVHSCNPVGKMPRSYHMLHVAASWFHKRLGMELFQKRNLGITRPLIRDVALFSRALALIDTLKAGSVTPEADLRALLVRMQTLHHCFSPAVETSGSRTRVLPDSSITPQMIAGDYSISDLARDAGLSREGFSRSFHRDTGLSPGRYLHCLRLEHGRHLLRQGSSVVEASLASGYYDQSHFHRMFTKYCSVAPGSYRRNRSHPYKK